MKVFTFRESDSYLMLSAYLEEERVKQLFVALANDLCGSLNSYIFDTMVTYMTKYTSLNDLHLSLPEHNSIYDQFLPYSGMWGKTSNEIVLLNNVDYFTLPLSERSSNNLCVTFYEPLNEWLLKHHMDLYGVEFIEQNPDLFYEDLEALVGIMEYISAEVESRCLPYHRWEKTFYFLFAHHDDQLVVMVH